MATGVRVGRATITAALADVKVQVYLGVGYQILFSTQPGTTPVGKAISPGVRVQVRDNGDHRPRTCPSPSTLARIPPTQPS
jgi:hypothetical protein